MRIDRDRRGGERNFARSYQTFSPGFLGRFRGFRAREANSRRSLPRARDCVNSLIPGVFPHSRRALRRASETSAPRRARSAARSIAARGKRHFFRRSRGRISSFPEDRLSPRIQRAVRAMRTSWAIACCLVAAILAAHAKPTIYKRNEDNVFEPVMVPVSSTVIPLPVYKVGYGLGFISKDKKAQFKPEDLKLITIKRTQEKKT